MSLRPLAADLDDAIGWQPVPEEHLRVEGEDGDRVFIVTCGELERRITEHEMVAEHHEQTVARWQGYRVARADGPILRAVDELRAAHRRPYSHLTVQP